MRTTLDIEDDVLQAAKELAARENSTAGVVISRLAREGLLQPRHPVSNMPTRNGVPVIPARDDEIITLEHVRSLMEQESV